MLCDRDYIYSEIFVLLFSFIICLFLSFINMTHDGQQNIHNIFKLNLYLEDRFQQQGLVTIVLTSTKNHLQIIFQHKLMFILGQLVKAVSLIFQMLNAAKNFHSKCLSVKIMSLIQLAKMHLFLLRLSLDFQRLVLSILIISLVSKHGIINMVEQHLRFLISVLEVLHLLQICGII